MTGLGDRDSDQNSNMHKLLSGFGVGVQLEGSSSLLLELTCQEIESELGTDLLGSYREQRCPFQNSDQSIQVLVKLRFYDQFVMGFVEGRITNPSPFGRQSCFAGESGIILQTGVINGIQALMANYQHKDWWTRPHFDTRLTQLPERTLSLLWRMASSYYHILPVCGSTIRTDLSGGSDERLFIRLSSLNSGMTRWNETLAFIAGSGINPYQLVEAHAQAAMAVLKGQVLPREQKKYPEIMDTLGWCSWDAFYHQVSEEGLLSKVKELKQLGLPVRWVMIDDGWLDVKDGKLSSFEADPEKFPTGLANTVQLLKEKYEVQWVGVWHTLAGYWGGIEPSSDLASQYAAYLRTNARGSLLPAPDAGMGFGFWHAWHSFLKQQGIDFIKVDSQSAIMNFWRGKQSVGEAASAAHVSLEASAALHFDNTIINCMGMASENVWHRPKSAISRNSDDFVPQDRFGFSEHALQNGYNSYYHGAFYWGDWDMFWTKNHDDLQNAVLRSISGGPLYFSDALGNTDPAKLWPLIYRDGQIIRCDRTPYPTEDCLLVDPTVHQLPLKLWNKIGNNGVVAAFHIGKYQEEIAGKVGPQDIHGLIEREDQRFVIYEHFTKKLVIVQAHEKLDFLLEEQGYALYSLIALQNGITPIGLTNKYISSHSILSCEASGKDTRVKLRESGDFLFSADRMPTEVRVLEKSVECIQLGEQLYEVKLEANEGVTIQITMD